MQNQGGVERFVVEVPIARPYAGTMSLCCTAAATITLATRPYACAHVSASSVSHDVPTKCFRAASRLAPDGVVVPSQHRSDGGHDQLLEEGHHIVELVTVRADSTQGAHQLVALPDIWIGNIEFSSGFLKKQRVESTVGHRRRRSRPSPT